VEKKVNPYDKIDFEAPYPPQVSVKTVKLRCSRNWCLRFAMV
jgi:hypothetical protein